MATSVLRKDSLSLMSTPRLIVKNYTAAERTFIMFLVTWVSKKWHNHNPWEPFYKSRSSLARDIGVSQSLVSKMNKKITDGLIPFISREDKVVIGLNHVTHYTVDKDKFFEFCYPDQASNQASKNEPNKLSKKETPSVSNDIPAVSNDTAPTLYMKLTNINQSLTTLSLPTLSLDGFSL